VPLLSITGVDGLLTAVALHATGCLHDDYEALIYLEETRAPGNAKAVAGQI
jgi:hypothetical protein